MQLYFDSKQKVEVVSIIAGERYVSAEGRVIATLLGSCVAVTLYDPIRKIGGMNHFMLPQPPDMERAHQLEGGKYGIEAMELLIDDLLRLGAGRRLIAKVFGGGHILGIGEAGRNAVSDDNVRFAVSYLRKKDIPIGAKNVGGYHGRKVFFYTENGKIRLRRISKGPLNHGETTEARPPDTNMRGG